MLITLLIILLIVGALLAILQVAPIDATIKRIAYIVIIVGAIIYALRLLAPILPGV